MSSGRPWPVCYHAVAMFDGTDEPRGACSCLSVCLSVRSLAGPAWATPEQRSRSYRQLCNEIESRWTERTPSRRVSSTTSRPSLNRHCTTICCRPAFLPSNLHRPPTPTVCPRFPVSVTFLISLPVYIVLQSASGRPIIIFFCHTKGRRR